MKPWNMALAGLALLTIAGCRSDPAIPVLERELRLKEDEIYRLQAMVDDVQDGASSCQDWSDSDSASAESEVTTPRRRAASNGANGVKPPMIELPSRPADKVPDTLKTPAGALPPGLEVPEHLRGPSKPLGPTGAEPAEPSTNRGFLPDRRESEGPALQRSAAAMRPRSGRATTASRSASGTPLMPSGDSEQVAAIALNRILTGGMNTGHGDGDQGLLVVVEPRDRAGRTIDAPAEVIVVVLDPAIEGEAARVARWDFSAAETAALFRRTGETEAIHLTTAWPGDPPKHNKLRLFVRYVTADGRWLEANTPIEVALPGDKTAQSTPDKVEAVAEGTAVGEPTAESWQLSPAPHMATRSDEPKPCRPVWSPERR